MEILEAIITRRSIRKYKDIPVEWDKVGTILEAGRWAPSSGNIQNWKFITIEDKEKIKQLAEACAEQLWIATAPFIILVVAEPNPAIRHYGVRGDRLYTVQNCSCAAMNMMLAAHSVGLGTCWIGAFDEERVKAIVELPEQIRPQMLLTVGYADEEPKIPWKLTVEDVQFFRSYGGQGNKVRDLELNSNNTSHFVGAAIKKGANLLKKFMKKE